MAAISDIVKKFTGEDELAKTQQALIESMAEMGQAKAEIFKLEIQRAILDAGQGSNKTIPVEAIVDQKAIVRAFADESADQITAEVRAIAGSFIKGGSGGVLDGISGILGSLITVFLGKSSASSGLMEEYYVMTAGLSIIRVDVRAWYLNVSVEQVYKVMRRVCVFVATKSTVDLSRIRFNTFLSLYGDQLAEGKLTPEQIRAALDEARELYRIYQEMSQSDASDTVVSLPPGSRRAEHVQLT